MIIKPKDAKPKDTSGFYKANGDKLSFAPNTVRAPTYDLFRADKDTYTYPVEGWSWFGSEDEAKAFLAFRSK